MFKTMTPPKIAHKTLYVKVSKTRFLNLLSQRSDLIRPIPKLWINNSELCQLFTYLSMDYQQFRKQELTHQQSHPLISLYDCIGIDCIPIRVNRIQKKRTLSHIHIRMTRENTFFGSTLAPQPNSHRMIQ